MNAKLSAGLLMLGLAAFGGKDARAADSARLEEVAAASKTYVLTPNDVILMRVYQEDDLETKARIARDGTASFPLIGTLTIGGKTVAEATEIIRAALEKDYLVNPQVSLGVAEYAKRRFTVLGQTQKPGSYEIPNEESIDLLQAIAMAGGFTRLADTGHITVKRRIDGRDLLFSVNARSMAKDSNSGHFEIQPEDTITVGERIF